MLSQNDIKKIKKLTEEFFRRMALEVEVEVLPPQDSTVFINLKLADPRVLIGERGQTLAEVQHLLKAVLKRQISEPFFIDLDILGYKKKKVEYLKELARSLADEVALTKKEKQLEPMPAYERRIIHLELADRSDVTTESIGQEPARSVVIRPYP